LPGAPSRARIAAAYLIDDEPPEGAGRTDPATLDDRPLAL